MAKTETLADYLPLYLGQKFIFTQLDGTYNSAYSIPTELTLEVLLMQRGHESRIRLLLRPLSSMTEEEMVELVHRQHRSIMANIDRTTITKIGWAYKDSYNGINVSWFRKQGSGASSGSNTIHINKSDPEQFLYLLSEGFDLFNLQRKGLAIYPEEL